MICGRVCDENQRRTRRVRLGDTRNGRSSNTDNQYHSFHIHQTAFLVNRGEQAVRRSEDGLRYTFSVPPATPWKVRAY